MKHKPIILKLGGSVITHKEQHMSPNLTAIERLTNEISKANVSSLIIIHGGGSYGHPIAKIHGISNGLKDESMLIGISETHERMVCLNQIIVKQLIMKGISAFGMSPSSFTLTRKGRIATLDERILKQTLDIGLVPVLHGDVVLDIDQGCAILSGDQLASLLAVVLGAEKIIMGVDVDGIYTYEPKKNSAALLIPTLRLRDLETMDVTLAEPMVMDVTGGMFGKVSELKMAVLEGIVTIIVNALKPNIILKALTGESVDGTRIEQ